MAHHGLTELISVDSMHERKQKMADLSDGFVALPGGIGTMEELFEAFSWLQLGLHSKPVGLLNVSGFHDSLLEFLAHMRGQRFLKAEHLNSLVVDADLDTLLKQMSAVCPDRFEFQVAGPTLSGPLGASRHQRPRLSCNPACAEGHLYRDKNR